MLRLVLVFSRRTDDRDRQVAAVRSDPRQAGIGVTDLGHLLGVARMVGGGVQHTSETQPVGNHGNGGGLKQPAFVVPLLRPGVRKQDQDFVQCLRCNLVCQNFNCIVADDPDMGQLALFETQQQAADAGLYMAKQAAAKGKPNPKLTKKEQSERFIRAARKIGVDESGAEFDRTLEKVVPPKRKRER